MSLSSLPSLKANHGALAIILYVAVSFTAQTVDAISAQTVIDSPLLTQKIKTNRTIKVDINGNGDYKTVQEAVDAVPENNSEWIIIHVRKGVYRHYYESCYIQGSIDFIFGRGRSLFQSCEIFVIADFRLKISGSITAHNREQDDESGFVFSKGKVYGYGGVYLGRAKGAYFRTIFSETYLSRTIVPHGWTNWSYVGRTDDIFQAEYKCKGPGADPDHRAPWAKQLPKEENERFTSIDFIDGQEWLPA